jgi:hypothetical protein
MQVKGDKMGKGIGKKGQLFGLYLVILTLFMCGIVVWIYMIQNSGTNSALVSPKTVLDIGDEQKIFEISEKALIKESIEESLGEGDWSDKDFKDNVKEKYCGKFSTQDFANFVFENIAIESISVTSNAFDSPAERKSFCMNNENGYVFLVNGDELDAERDFEKSLNLFPGAKAKHQFVVGFDYSLSKKYKFEKGEFN